MRVCTQQVWGKAEPTCPLQTMNQGATDSIQMSAIGFLLTYQHSHSKTIQKQATASPLPETLGHVLAGCSKTIWNGLGRNLRCPFSCLLPVQSEATSPQWDCRPVVSSAVTRQKWGSGQDVVSLRKFSFSLRDRTLYV